MRSNMQTEQKIKLEVRNISIEFPGVKALSGVDFSIETGEIRAVVGANGAGKSTLMKVLTGVNPGYTGDIYFNGEKVDIRNPQKAKELGIEIVYQEVDMALFPAQTVAENIMMNKMVSGMKRRFYINWSRMRAEAKNVLKRLNINIDVDKLVGDLSLAQKQMVLVARAVREKCNFLILDEPTAPLSITETQELFHIVENLMETGNIAVMFISHRLQEVMELCRSVTVMRNGKLVENMPVTPELTIKTIVDKMLGRSFDENFPKVSLTVGERSLEVNNISDIQNIVKDVSLYVRKGEIVGISGLVGAGKTELCKLLFGDMRKARGQVLLNGKELKIKSPTDAVNARLGLVPEERRKEGILVDEPVYFNLSAACLSRFSSKIGFVNQRSEIKNAKHYIDSLGIKTPSENQLVRYLSGGNQQKVAVGKWLAADCEVYIFDEPTKGVDVGAKHDIFQLIQNIAQSGKCVLYVTSETAEILAITDRTYVMYDGCIMAELITSETSEEEIMYYSTGGK
jgi:simple sugar transport system ATP-binding protein